MTQASEQASERASEQAPSAGAEFGLVFRTAREQADMTLDEVADGLHLSPTVIEAIEDGRFAALPARPYVRGYVRNYARLLGLDEEDMAVRFDAADAGRAEPSFAVPRPLVKDRSELALRPLALGYAAIVAVLIIALGAVLWTAWRVQGRPFPFFAPEAETPTQVDSPAVVRDTQTGLPDVSPWPSVAEEALAAEGDADESDTAAGQDATGAAAEGADADAEAVATGVADEDAAAEAVATDAADEGAAAEAVATGVADEDAAAEAVATGVADEGAAAEAVATGVADEDAAAEAVATGVADEDAAAEAVATGVADEGAAAEAVATGAADEDTDAEAVATGVADQRAVTERGAAVDDIATEEAGAASPEQAAPAGAIAGADQVETVDPASADAEGDTDQREADSPEPVAVGALAARATPAAANRDNRATEPGRGELTMVFVGDSWVEVDDAAGTSLFADMGRNGRTVELEGEVPLDVLVGNAPAVRVEFNGERIDLGPLTRDDNVARLELGD